MLRTRITWLAVGIISAVVVSFVIPLCLLVRTMVHDRAMAEARVLAQSTATLVASVDDLSRLAVVIDPVIQAAATSSAGPIHLCVTLPDGTRIGPADDGFDSDGFDLRFGASLGIVRFAAARAGPTARLGLILGGGGFGLGTRFCGIGLDSLGGIGLRLAVALALALAILATAGPIVAIAWYGDPVQRAMVAHGVVWFMAFGSLRTLCELIAQRARGQGIGSDADQLALTGMPAWVWITLWLLLCALNLWCTARWLVALP